MSAAAPMKIADIRKIPVEIAAIQPKVIMAIAVRFISDRVLYRCHRNVINLGIATGGALIGGIAGDRRGAGVGALIGAGSGALYTCVLNRKKRRC